MRTVFPAVPTWARRGLLFILHQHMEDPESSERSGPQLADPKRHSQETVFCRPSVPSPGLLGGVTAGVSLSHPTLFP